MSAYAAVSPIRSLTLVVRSVFIQLLRRQEFYVLFILMGIFLIGAILSTIVGIQNASTATFLLNLGMTLAYVAAHVLTLVLAARQIPDEIERRTLYPLLAKPVGRGTVYFAKWAASTLSGIGALTVLLAFGWLPVPKLETYSTVLLLQTVLLLFLSLSMMAAMAMLLSLLVPRGVNIILLVLLLLFGDKLIGFIRARFLATPYESVADWLAAYIPDFSKLNLVTRYTDGIHALSAGDFAGVILYTLIVIAVCLVFGMWIFERRPL